MASVASSMLLLQVLLKLALVVSRADAQQQCYASDIIGNTDRAARDGIMFNVKVIDESLPGVLLNGAHLCFEAKSMCMREYVVAYVCVQTRACVFLCVDCNNREHAYGGTRRNCVQREGN